MRSLGETLTIESPQNGLKAVSYTHLDVYKRQGYRERGGLQPPHIEASPRKLYLLQRKASKVGDGLGKTTGLSLIHI